VAALVAGSLAGPPARAEKPKQVSAAELARLGFFQDFDELSLEELLEVEAPTVSVASGTELSLDQAPGSVSVIDEGRIRRLGARTLRELLEMLPGFDVVTDNLGREKIVARGMESVVGASEGVLLLVDGRRLNDELTGGVTLLHRRLAVFQIKRLEVLRGPGSALYGGGALAAVINVVTHRPGELSGIEVLPAGGSFGTKEVSLRVGGPIGGVDLAGFVRFEDDNGARLAVPADAQTTIDQQNPAREPLSLAPGETTDDERILEGLYRIAYKGLTVDWLLKNERSEGLVGVSDSLSSQTELTNRQMILSASYRHALGEEGSVMGRLGWERGELRELVETYPPGFSVGEGIDQATLPSGGLLQSSLKSQRLSLDGQLERRFASHRLLAGMSLAREKTRDLSADANLDYRDLTIVSEGELVPLIGAVPDASRTIVAAFAQDTWQLAGPSLSLTGGVRVDRYDDVGTLASPHLAAVLSLPRSLTLKATYGRAFRAPSFRELYFDLPRLVGNPELDPVTSDTLELGLGRTGRRVEVRGTGFLSFVHSPIVTDGPASVAEPKLLINGPRRDVMGLEIEAQAQIGRHLGTASVTFLRARVAETGEPVADVPGVMATFGATLAFGERYTVTPRLRIRSSSPRLEGDPRPDFGGRALFDVCFRGENVIRNLDLRATFRNLFDAEYFDPSPWNGVPGDYPRPGVSVIVDAAYRF
jgi:iron complex outermembrane receptor protein